MRLHREGLLTILLIILVSCLTVYAAWAWLPRVAVWPIAAVMAVLLGIVVWFFRSPLRPQGGNDTLVLAPCDGKVVVVEEVTETEYFKDRRVQVSIFMSPLNVHVNYHPINGTITYRQYHKGKYLVVKHASHGEVLIRQIAGALARRIRTYPNPGDPVVQGTEMGFIKFGSRVDLFLPLTANIAVRVGEVVKGATSIIAQNED
jgi:phosphatidylserine decarboxylase